MRKKFLSALLFGVVLTTATGTFVSCKDYDDDIDNLQEQINKLATADELKASISDLNAAISAAKSEAEAKAAAAQATADAAKQGADAAAAKVAELEANGATKAEVEAAQEVANAAQAAADNAAAAAAEAAEKIAANATEISTLAEKVAALETKVNGMSNAEIEADITQLQKDVLALQEEMKALGVSVTTVTSVSLYVNGEFGQTGTLTFKSVTEQANEFGKTPAADRTLTFTAGATKTYSDDLVIRVSPVDATLNKNSISLINSQGTTLDMIEIEDVKRYEGDPLFATRAAEGNSGLWTVSLKLKDGYDAEAFAKAVKVLKDGSTTDYNYIGFAVAVNTEADAENNRRVISAFDVTVDAEDATALSFVNTLGTNGDNAIASIYVNDKKINDLQNRYGAKKNGQTKIDYVWKTSSKDYPTPAVAPIANATDASKSNLSDGDNRSTNALLPLVYNATNGEKVTIKFNYDGKKFNGEEIAGFYVTMDMDYASVDGESDESEIVAWKYYESTIEGLNTMFDGNEGSITIKGVENDVVGFRIYAVNLDGTLVDPDGMAFYVYVGEGEEKSTIAGDCKWNGSTFVSDYIEVGDGQWTTDAIAAINAAGTDVSKWSGITGGDDWTDATKRLKVAFSIAFYDKDKKVTTDDSKVKYVKFTLPAAKDFVDGNEYTQSIGITGKNGIQKKVITFSTKKVMPTDAPEGFSAKDQQIINGIYTCYLQPTGGWNVAAAAATTGTMTLGSAFNGLFNTDNSLKDGNYQFVFANSADKDFSKGTFNNVTVTGNEYLLSIANNQAGWSANPATATNFIDGKTEHATTVNYNFGLISTKLGKDADNKDEWKVGVAHNVPVDEFKTVYACWADAQTWDWKAPLVGKDKTTYYATDAALYGVGLLVPGSRTETESAADTPQTFDATSILGKNTYNGMVFGKTFADLAQTAVGKPLQIKEVKLITTSTKEEEYFKVSTTFEFTPLKKDVDSNPKGDVASTLIITCIDCYHHTVTIELPFTVVPQ